MSDIFFLSNIKREIYQRYILTKMINDKSTHSSSFLRSGNSRDNSVRYHRARMRESLIGFPENRIRNVARYYFHFRNAFEIRISDENVNFTKHIFRDFLTFFRLSSARNVIYVRWRRNALVPKYFPSSLSLSVTHGDGALFS